MGIILAFYMQVLMLLLAILQPILINLLVQLKRIDLLYNDFMLEHSKTIKSIMPINYYWELIFNQKNVF